ncbi:MAG: hypothetical protein RLN72_02035 [Henriciella sp.]
MVDGQPAIESYFKDFEPLPHFEKTYVSLWDGWLGPERSHLLDDVTREDELKLVDFYWSLATRFEVFRIDLKVGTVARFGGPDRRSLAADVINGSRTHAQFFKLIVPALDCLVTEEWDYTAIIWHRSETAPAQLLDMVESAGLKHFTDQVEAN